MRRAFAEPRQLRQLLYVSGTGITERVPVFGCRSPVALIVPSRVDRCSDESFRRVLARAATEAHRAGQATGAEFLIVAVLQGENPAAIRRSVARLRSLHSEWPFLCPLAGVVASPPSKLLAINACLPLLRANEARAVMWIDDDVELEEGCVAQLWRAFDPASGAIYGGRKVTIGDRSRFSRRWADRKNSIEPVNRYPHGCCLLMALPELGDGIPVVYQTDDHYFLLEHLDAERADPFAMLRVVADARVFCPAANDLRTTLRRIRRNYTNVLRVLADAPPATVRFFLRQLMFDRLRTPRSARDLVSAAYGFGLAWHGLKVLFWLSCLVPVVVRGLLNRPFVPRWYSAPFPQTLRVDEPEHRS